MRFGQQPVGSRGEHHLQRPGLVIDHHHQIEKQKLQIGQGEVPAGQRREHFVVPNGIITQIPDGSTDKRRQGIGTRNQARAQEPE